MKKFDIYKNIRKRAIIFGLPLTLFALMMIAIIASLLVIIFSFSFGIIFGVLVFNLSLYAALLWITKHPKLFEFGNSFPKIISNKRNSGLNYEQD